MEQVNSREQNHIFIAPDLAGFGITPQTLVAEANMFVAQFDLFENCEETSAVTYAEARGDTFHLNLSRHGNTFVIERNGRRLSLQVPCETVSPPEIFRNCLLYTSDAADE